MPPVTRAFRYGPLLLLHIVVAFTGRTLPPGRPATVCTGFVIMKNRGQGPGGWSEKSMNADPEAAPPSQG